MKSEELPMQVWIVILVLALLLFVDAPGCLTMAWNLSVPEIFPSVQPLTYWRAFWLLVVCAFLSLPGSWRK